MLPVKNNTWYLVGVVIITAVLLAGFLSGCGSPSLSEDWLYKTYPAGK